MWIGSQPGRENEVKAPSHSYVSGAGGVISYAFALLCSTSSVRRRKLATIIQGLAVALSARLSSCFRPKARFGSAPGVARRRPWQAGNCHVKEGKAKRVNVW